MTQAQIETAEALAEAAATLQIADLALDAERLYRRAATLYEHAGELESRDRCLAYAAECEAQ